MPDLAYTIFIKYCSDRFVVFDVFKLFLNRRSSKNILQISGCVNYTDLLYLRNILAVVSQVFRIPV